MPSDVFRLVGDIGKAAVLVLDSASTMCPLMALLLFRIRMLFAFLAVVEFGGGGEEGVAAAVEGRFDTVLHHADDEADGDGLHCDIVGDAEE